MINTNNFYTSTSTPKFQGKKNIAKKVINNIRYNPKDKEHIQIIMNSNISPEDKKFILDNSLQASINPFHYVNNIMKNVIYKFKKN